MIDHDKYSVVISLYHINSTIALVKDNQIISINQEKTYSNKESDNNFPKLALSDIFKKFQLDQDKIEKIIISYPKKYYFKLKIIDNLDLKIFELMINYFNQKISKIKLINNLKLIKELAHNQSITKILKNKILFCDDYLSLIYGSLLINENNNFAFMLYNQANQNFQIGFVKNNKIKLIDNIALNNNLDQLYQAIVDFVKALKIKFDNQDYDHQLKQKYYKIIEKSIINLKQDGTYQINQKYFKKTGDKIIANINFKNFFYDKIYIDYQVDKKIILSFINGLKELIKKIILDQAKNLRKISGTNNLILSKSNLYNFEIVNLIMDLKIFTSYKFQNIDQAIIDSIGTAYQSINCKHPIKIDDSIKFIIKNNLTNQAYKTDNIIDFFNNYSIKYFMVDDQHQLLKIIINSLEKNKFIIFFNQSKLQANNLQDRLLMVELNTNNLQKIKKIFGNIEIIASQKNQGINKNYLISDEVFFPTNKNSKKNYGFQKKIIEQKFILDFPLIENLLSHNYNDKTNNMLITMPLKLANNNLINSLSQCYKFFMSNEIDILVIENFIIFREDQVFE
jgi:carbamoyltransferase